MTYVETLLELPIESVLSLSFLVFVGIFLTYWARRFELQGVELWLPLGILVSYAIDPLVGVIVAMSILVASYIIYPFPLRSMLIILVSLGATLYTIPYVQITTINFVTPLVTLAVIYSVISGTIYLSAGESAVRSLKFSALSIYSSWVIFNRIGLELLTWLASGEGPWFLLGI